ncbi:MAG: hypothetical protein H7Y86_22235 [Rhizobacter sp.]|nr:hypothetical protein [Ferruginibacter sp.]
MEDNYLQVGFQTHNTTAANIGLAARLAGHWSNGLFIAVVLHLGRTYIVGLCLLTCTVISLISSGSGLEEQ